MHHSIKVRDEVYDDLRRLQRPRETYNEVISRLLMIAKPLLEAARILGPSHSLMERPKKEAKEDALP